MTLQQELRRQRISDQLVALAAVNVAQLPGETYEQNLMRRAELQSRVDSLREELCRG